MKLFTYLLLLCLFSQPGVDCAADGDGYFMYIDFWCSLSSREPQQVEYLVDWYVNREFMMQFNSTVGNWTGFTPAGLMYAPQLNIDEKEHLQRELERKLICVDHVGLIFNASEINMAEPTVTLVESSGADDITMLVCSAYDFFPRNIRVTWLRDGQEVTSGVTSSEVMSNEDWTYQVHSYLEVSPGGQDRVSCMVEHATLREPTIQSWDFSQSERRYLVGGVCALLVGAVCLSWGLIQYRRKSCDPRFPPSNFETIALSSMPVKTYM
ncbi:rano class II histocompatibility antigen, A beta chain-like [Centropristis striata]|uniref:rano class II histocompatibility antigen, A beta chain-like n=1 Tax=Centropristis striata TaxID=184440 RepID=UPI0027DF00AE|nr:rano class II histocompatibility antigen, A beta chain-like [Centropristis striata]